MSIMMSIYMAMGINEYSCSTYPSGEYPSW